MGCRRCGCTFTEGAGIDLTGSGSLSDPFVISADLSEVAAATQSVDFFNDGDAVVGTGLHRWYPPVNATVVAVRVSAGVAPTGASLIIDAHKAGVTIFTTQGNRPTIVAGGFTDTSVPDVTSVLTTEYLTIDVDQVGSSEPGEALVAQVYWRPA